jgi:ferrous iron transport protein B
VLATGLILLFQAIFNWAALPQDAIEQAMGWLGLKVEQVLPEGAFRDLLVQGVVGGVGSVLVFLPQILLLFLFIIMLEDSGYMARAAFLMDRFMGLFGLQGKSFIPLLSSHACAIPGIMATRTIENPRDRLVTLFIAPLTTCSARLPVYALLIGAFIPNLPVWGPFHLQGLVLLALYILSFAAVLGTAALLKKSILRGASSTLFLELPAYKRPSLRNLITGLAERASLFVKRAGTIILSLSILLWFLASYPKPPPEATKPAIHYSYAGRTGAILEPFFRPIGFDWHITTGLIPGFAAREVMVSALSTVFAVEEKPEASTPGTDSQNQQLAERILQAWGLPTALSLLVWYVFAPQCLSTLAVIRRETQSWKWSMAIMGYMLLLAYGGSWLTYRISIFLHNAWVNT